MFQKGYGGNPAISRPQRQTRSAGGNAIKGLEAMTARAAKGGEGSHV
jgi:hypothetical protein